ncbi:MAG: regulatory protein RecX [Candidatus Solibacter sp.]|nr:regulatory protein RecX [Candidatus Solibacter sp.]
MQQRKPRYLDSEGLWNYALKVLGGRAHSIGELREKMRRRTEHPEEIEAVIARLKESKYLDDQRFAEGFATARLSNEGFGKTRVMQDLRQRRVAPALAEKTVTSVYQEVDEFALIEDWIRRKYRTVPREGLFQGEKDLAKAYRRLARAGFRTGEIVRALKKFAKNPELLDNFEPPEEIDEE